MKTKQKKKVFTWRINLFIFIIFALGAIFGIAISDFSVGSLQGYLASKLTTIEETNSYVDLEGYNYATNPNATCSNVATPGTATNGNATSANATSSNAADDYIILTRLSLLESNGKPGTKIYIDMGTSGNCLNGATFTFKNPSNGFSFVTNLDYNGPGNKCIEIPADTLPGKYQLTGLLLIGTSYGSGTFTKNYGTTNSLSTTKLEYDISLTVDKDETKKDIKLSGINFEKDEVNLGEELYFTYEADEEVNSIKFTFRNIEDNSIVYAYMREKNNQKYISFASNTKEGKYVLEEVILSNNNNITAYSIDGRNSSEVFNFNTEVTLKKVENEKVELNNEDITEKIIIEMIKSESVNTIVINADSKSIISSDIFNAIKGTNKVLIINYKDTQYVFNGIDINTPKDIDVGLKIYSLKYSTKDDDMKSLTSEGMILNFASNGNLPSEATVKVKQNKEMSVMLEGKNIYVYYFDESTNKFEEIEKNIPLKDGYYEFNITHNSRYLLTTQPLDEKLLQENDDGIVSFLMDNKIYLALILLAILLIILILIVIIVYFAKKSKKRKPVVVENKTEKKEEENKEINSQNNDTSKADMNN